MSLPPGLPLGFTPRGSFLSTRSAPVHSSESGAGLRYHHSRHWPARSGDNGHRWRRSGVPKRLFVDAHWFGQPLARICGHHVNSWSEHAACRKWRCHSFQLHRGKLKKRRSLAPRPSSPVVVVHPAREFQTRADWATVANIRREATHPLQNQDACSLCSRRMRLRRLSGHRIAYTSPDKNKGPLAMGAFVKFQYGLADNTTMRYSELATGDRLMNVGGNGSAAFQPCWRATDAAAF
jgi:hypothetical protein